MKKIYAFLAQGFEETEALMVIDLMRRSYTIDVGTVSVTDELMVESSHKVNIMADKLIKDINFDEGLINLEYLCDSLNYNYLSYSNDVKEKLSIFISYVIKKIS